MLRVCSIKFFRVFDNTYYCCFYFLASPKPPPFGVRAFFAFVELTLTRERERSEHRQERKEKKEKQGACKLFFVVFCGLILILYLKRIAEISRTAAKYNIIFRP